MGSDGRIAVLFKIHNNCKQYIVQALGSVASHIPLFIFIKV